jgi:hypothetical protein
MRRREDQILRARRRRRGLFILPSLFTAFNIAAGYYAMSQTLQGALNESWHFDNAAKAIGFAVVFDGLDGRIARMTNTTSDFGRELDSLADVIAFGVAPALLAWMWGFRLLDVGGRFNVGQLGLIFTGWRASTSRRIRNLPIPGGRDASTLSACPFPRGRAWSARWCTLPTGARCNTGGKGWDGARSSSPRRFSW